MVAGGGTIVLTLTDDVWVLGTFDAQRQAIIDGLDSDGVELLGWNNEVRDKLPVTAVVRTSATVVTITLDAQAAYDITASETVTVTVPAAALDTYGSEVVAIPTFTISTDVVEGGGGSSKGRPGGSDRRRKKKKPRKEPEKWVDPKRAEIYRKAGTELEPPKVGPKKKVAKAVTEMLGPAVVPIDEGILPESLKPATSATSATSATEARKPEPVAVSGAAVAVPGAAVTEPELDKLDEIIDEALEEDEEEAEKQAQEFVDQFKQEGGQ